MANESIKMTETEEVHQQREDRDYVPNGEVNAFGDGNSSCVSTKNMAQKGHEVMEGNDEKQGDKNEETTEKSAATTEENVGDEDVVIVKNDGDGKQDEVVLSENDEFVGEKDADEKNCDEHSNDNDDGRKKSNCQVNDGSSKADESEVHEITDNDKDIDSLRNSDKNDERIQLNDSEGNDEDNVEGDEVMIIDGGTPKENVTTEKRRRNGDVSGFEDDNSSSVSTKTMTHGRHEVMNIDKRTAEETAATAAENVGDEETVLAKDNGNDEGKQEEVISSKDDDPIEKRRRSSESEIIELDTTPVKKKVKKSTDECTPRRSLRNLNKKIKSYKDDDEVDKPVRHRYSENSYIGETLAEDPLALNIDEQKVKKVIKPARNNNNSGGSKFNYHNSCNKKEPNFVTIDINSILPSRRPVLMNDKQAMAGGSVVLPINDHLSRNQVPQQQSHKNKLHQQDISINPLPGPSATPSAYMTSTKPGDTNPKKWPAECEICDSRIKNLEQLCNHMEWVHKVTIHSKLIFNCRECIKRFFTDQGLERHLLCSHGLVTLSMQATAKNSKIAVKCHECGFYHQNLPNHLERDHGMTLKPCHFPYKCTVCTGAFGTLKQLKRHSTSVHSVVVAKRAMDKKVPPAAKSAGDSLMKPTKINDQITTIFLPANTISSEEDSPATSRDSAGSSKSL